MQDLTPLKERILSAASADTPLVIRGGGSKDFYGRAASGEVLDTRLCSGIVSYEPSELVLTALAGTPLQEVESALAEKKQMLAFEPPRFGAAATIGGVVACGLSGPRRPYAGSVRDYVLGVQCMNGRGEILKFGGQVMKNVAGYDVSRLMTGALGTLGLLLEVSLKVQPMPEHELSLAGNADFATALRWMNVWAGQPLPLSAACHSEETLRIRLSGNRNAVVAAARSLVKVVAAEEDPVFWRELREQQLPFFQNSSRPLWRLSVPPATPALEIRGDWLCDWGGAQRWLRSEESPARIQMVTQQAGGHATLFRGGDRHGSVFQPLAPALHALHARLKLAFDPARVLNRGRMYPDL